MENTKITVVTVCHNAEQEIEATMRSVLNQTYLNLEYILIDGASQDHTLDVIKRIKEEYSDREVKFLSEADSGIYDAMNKGIDLATGEWINFMNVGDIFADAAVLQEFFAMVDTERPNDILYGDVIYRYPFGEYYRDCHPEKDGVHFCHQATFARTSLMKQKHFDLKYKIVADFNFLLQCQREGSLCSYCPRVIASCRYYGGLTQNVFNWRIIKLEKYQAEGKPKRWSYCKLLIGAFLQTHFHIRKFWIDQETEQKKKIAANSRLRKISDSDKKHLSIHGKD